MSNEVINPSTEQNALLARLKAYDAAEENNIQHRKAYAYLKGRTAIALKGICAQGEFVPLLQSVFTENKVRWTQYCMNFAEAVESRKNALGAFITDDRLLGAGDFSDAEQKKIVETVIKSTGDKGIKDVIQNWKKKTRPKDHKPKNAVTDERKRVKNIEATFESGEANLTRLLQLKDVDYVLAGKPLRKSVVALCKRIVKREEELG